ncbi:MAG: hypothetical protein ABSD59_23920, partial [Terracidiphilus sp.]
HADSERGRTHTQGLGDKDTRLKILLISELPPSTVYLARRIPFTYGLFQVLDCEFGEFEHAWHGAVYGTPDSCLKRPSRIPMSRWAADLQV